VAGSSGLRLRIDARLQLGGISHVLPLVLANVSHHPQAEKERFDEVPEGSHGAVILVADEQHVPAVDAFVIMLVALHAKLFDGGNDHPVVNDAVRQTVIADVPERLVHALACQ
jgi:hypothetical protein